MSAVKQKKDSTKHILEEYSKFFNLGNVTATERKARADFDRKENIRSDFDRKENIQSDFDRKENIQSDLKYARDLQIKGGSKQLPPLEKYRDFPDQTVYKSFDEKSNYHSFDEKSSNYQDVSTGTLFNSFDRSLNNSNKSLDLSDINIEPPKEPPRYLRPQQRRGNPFDDSFDKEDKPWESFRKSKRRPGLKMRINNKISEIGSRPVTPRDSFNESYDWRFPGRDSFLGMNDSINSDVGAGYDNDFWTPDKLLHPTWWDKTITYWRESTRWWDNGLYDKESLENLELQDMIWDSGWLIVYAIMISTALLIATTYGYYLFKSEHFFRYYIDDGVTKEEMDSDEQLKIDAASHLWGITREDWNWIALCWLFIMGMLFLCYLFWSRWVGNVLLDSQGRRLR